MALIVKMRKLGFSYQGKFSEQIFFHYMKLLVTSTFSSDYYSAVFELCYRAYTDQYSGDLGVIHTYLTSFRAEKGSH